MSVEEVEVIRDMFALMDTDRDGKVTYEELRTGLRKVGSQLAEPEIKMLMEVVNFYACLSADLKVTSVIFRDKNYHTWFTGQHTLDSPLIRPFLLKPLSSCCYPQNPADAICSLLLCKLWHLPMFSMK